MDGVLNGFRSKLDLVNVKLLILKIAQLCVVHLLPSQHAQGLLLQIFVGSALRRLHLLLYFCQFQIALVYLSLNHLSSVSKLYIWLEERTLLLQRCLGE